jgi:CheY-like chemotaxis protein
MTDDLAHSHAMHECFVRDLRFALTQLYNPGALRANSLVALLGLGERRESALALQNVLLDAIERMRPAKKAPQWSQQWRTYQILRRRYSEQVPQCTVALDLGLSIRQLQREEKQAREVLADQLWADYDVQGRVEALAAPAVRADQTALGTSAPVISNQADQAGGRAEELAWLRDHLPPEMTDVRQMTDRALATVRPLLEAACVTTEARSPVDFPALLLPGLLLHQALLSTITAAIGAIPGGVLRITLGLEGNQVSVRVRGISYEASDAAEDRDAAEGLRMAEEILAYCGGALVVETAGPDISGDRTGEIQAFGAQLLVPVAQRGAILVVDDNADARQLFQRHLAGPRYHFIGAESAAEAVRLAAEERPDAIILDVMMPRQDGWALLGQLREHPETRGVPVIVCTILPQEDLALTLGAAAFLRKPVSREALLSALDRQLGRSPPAP